MHLRAWGGERLREFTLCCAGVEQLFCYIFHSLGLLGTACALGIAKHWAC